MTSSDKIKDYKPGDFRLETKDCCKSYTNIYISEYISMADKCHLRAILLSGCNSIEEPQGVKPTTAVVDIHERKMEGALLW